MNKQAAKYKISPKGKRKLDYSTRPSKSVKLPLIGKNIFLDVKETKHLKRLQQDLKKLGGTLEEFVSRDIDYLITSQPRPRNKAASPCGDENPSPSPFNCDPSPSPGYPEDKKVTSVTRGKALAEKARCTRQASTLLDNAEKWGVRIVSIEGAFKWIEKELKKLPKSVGNQSKKNLRTKCVSSYKIIKSPFVKLEGKSFCYRPFHLELDVWPRLNVDTPRGSCPFDGTLIKGGDESREERGELMAAQVDIPSEDTPKEEKDGSESTASTPKPAADKAGKKSESDVFGGSKIMTAGELKRRKDLKRKQERKRGYCECCHVKYEDLDKHVKEEQHKQYVKNKMNYQELDALISNGQNTQNFLFAYLAKVASIGNGSDKMICEDTVRRSPRKTVQESTLKSLSKSPRKVTPLFPLHTLKAPEKSVESTVHSVRVSPRIILQKKISHESSPLGKSVVSNAVSLKKSPASRTRKNGENMKREVESNIPNLNASVLDNAETTCYKSPSSRKNVTRLQNENKEHDICEKDRVNCQMVSDALKETERDSGPEKLRGLKKDNEKSDGLTLSPVNFDNTVLNKSPRKRETPRKELTKNVAEASDENASDLNKENVSPSKQRSDRLRNLSPVHAKTKRKLDNENDLAKDIETNIEIRNNNNRKCRENTDRTNSDLDNCSKDVCDDSVAENSATCPSDASHTEFELMKAGFTEILKCGRKRSQIEQSSDDFEVCFARSLVNDTLPELKKVREEITDRTFDKMVRQIGKVSKINKSKDISNVGNSCLTEKDTDDSMCEKLKSPKKKHRSTPLVNKKRFKGKLPEEKSTEKSAVETGTIVGGKEKDVYDIDENSDIPSDFQCYDKQGKLLTFSKTLAERIKERSVGRRTSVESYNVNVLFQLPSGSRSNSFSSNHSEKPTKTVTQSKKNCVKKLEKKKSGSSIASAKVLNKYRYRHVRVKPLEKIQTGYQGDDENEPTPDSNKLNNTHASQKKSKWKFWHYEPVDVTEENVEADENVRGLPKELRALKASNIWYSSDNSDSESRRGRLKQREKESTKNDIMKNGNKGCKVVKVLVEQLKESKNVQKAFDGPNKTVDLKKGAVDTGNIMDNEADMQDSDLQLKNDCGENSKKIKQTRKKTFWYYVPENIETDSDKDIESDSSLPRELLELKRSSRYFLKLHSNRTVSDNTRNKDMKKNEGMQTSSERVSNIQKGNRENERFIRNDKEIRHPDTLQERKKNPDTESSNDDSEKTATKSKRQKNRYWHFVEEAVEEINIEKDRKLLENLPKELKILKDAWAVDPTLNRSDRRRARSTMSENVNTEESDFGENNDQDTLDDANLGQKSVKRNSKDFNESERNESKNTNKMSTKRSWDVVEMEEENDKDITNLPKEFRVLKFSKADAVDSETSDIEKMPRIRCKVRRKKILGDNDGVSFKLRMRTSKVNYCESDSIETESDESDADIRGYRNHRYGSKFKEDRSELKQKTKITNKENKKGIREHDHGKGLETCKTGLDYQSRSKQGSVAETEDKSGDSDIDETGIQNCSNTSATKEKDKKRKYWEYVIETADEDTDKSELANLPKELRLLKEAWSLNSRSRSSSRSRSVNTNNNREERTGSELPSETEKLKNNDAFESGNQKLDSKRVTRENRDIDERNVIDTKKRAEGHITYPAESSDNERSRSQPRKRKVFWEYKDLPVEENTAVVDKSLPKELQILRDAWNNFSEVGGRRSRSLQSYSEVSDVETKKTTDCSPKRRVVHQDADTSDSENEELVLIDDEECFKNKSTTSVPEKKEADVNIGMEGKLLTEGCNKSVDKDLRISESVSDSETDEESCARSTSPVFNVIPNPVHKIPRRRSPVFYRSPRQVAKSDRDGKQCADKPKRLENKTKNAAKEHRLKAKIRSKDHSKRNKNAAVASKEKDNSVEEREVNSTRHREDFCEEGIDRNDQENLLKDTNSVTDCSIKTPEKSIKTVEQGSGYSNTPREKRRKQWKRKNMENDSVCEDRKKRKLEDGNYVVDSKDNEVTDTPSRSTPRRRLLEPSGTEGRDDANATETEWNPLKEKAEHAGHENTAEKFSLSWKPINSDTGESNHEKVKLNKSWTLLSERSVSKLLSSEDDNENFDGFTNEETLPSDMSFEEKSEVEIPKNDEHEWVLEDENEKEENLTQFVPVYFSSPDKTSNSSWNDAIEGYIDNSIKHGPESSFRGDSSTFFSFSTSPRKSPLKRLFTSPCKRAGVTKTTLQFPVKAVRPCTPKRKRHPQMHSPEVERIDNEIEFNFGSPQKNRSEFSPLKTVNGVVKNSLCAVNLTSTPLTKCTKKKKHRKH